MPDSIKLSAVTLTDADNKQQNDSYVRKPESVSIFILNFSSPEQTRHFGQLKHFCMPECTYSFKLKDVSFRTAPESPYFWQCRRHCISWGERRTRDWKVAGSNPCWSGGWIFFSRVKFLLTLISVSVPHRVTTVARKRSRPFCQKCRWQVTAKIRMHLV